MPIGEENKINSCCIQQRCPAWKYCHGCDERGCLFLGCDRQCWKCFWLCHRRNNLAGWLEDVGDIDLERKYNIHTDPLEITDSYIPTLLPTPGNNPEVINACCISARRIFSPNTLNPLTEDLQDYFHLNPGTVTILTFYAKDTFLENIWTYRMTKHFYDRIRLLKVDYVISVNFSNYLEIPHLEYYTNIKRSLLMLEKFCLWHKTILDVCSPNDATRDAYLKIILNHPIKSLGFNFQLAKNNVVKEKSKNEIIFFDSRLPKDIDFLITGLVNRKYLPEIFQKCPERKIIFTTSGPSVMAGHYNLKGNDKILTKEKAHGIFRDELKRKQKIIQEAKNEKSKNRPPEPA
jgi:hypothetical protein